MEDFRRYVEGVQRKYLELREGTHTDTVRLIGGKDGYQYPGRRGKLSFDRERGLVYHSDEEWDDDCCSEIKLWGYCEFDAARRLTIQSGEDTYIFISEEYENGTADDRVARQILFNELLKRGKDYAWWRSLEARGILEVVRQKKYLPIEEKQRLVNILKHIIYMKD